MVVATLRAQQQAEVAAENHQGQDQTSIIPQ
jgi:hypothetical protein